MIQYGWYAVFIRQMLLFRRKILKMGYVFSAMMMPVVYLIAFGFGLGGSVKIHGTDYLSFLVPGLAAMSSMNNSYNWVASSLNLNRLYFKNFQTFVQAPISPSSILAGEVLAGMVKGLFASMFIIIVGVCFAANLHISFPFIVALLLNTFLFASLGVITGMITKTHEDTSTYSNFLIMPMAFFSGTFFPVDQIPVLLKWFIYLLPLTHTNILIRKASFDQGALVSLLILIIYAFIFFICGSRLIKNYSE